MTNILSILFITLFFSCSVFSQNAERTPNTLNRYITEKRFFVSWGLTMQLSDYRGAHIDIGFRPLKKNKLFTITSGYEHAGTIDAVASENGIFLDDYTFAMNGLYLKTNIPTYSKIENEFINVYTYAKVVYSWISTKFLQDESIFANSNILGLTAGGGVEINLNKNWKFFSEFGYGHRFFLGNEIAKPYQPANLYGEFLTGLKIYLF